MAISERVVRHVPLEDLESTVRSGIELVASRLRDTEWSEVDPTDLAGGSLGVAVFELEAWRAGLLPDGDARAARRLEAALERHEARGPGTAVPALFSGYVGMAWVLEWARGRLLSEDDEPTEGVDGTLLEQMRAHPAEKPWPLGFDLISGLAGLGVYALERGARGAGPALLAEIVARLEREAARVSPGRAWFTPPEMLPAWQRAESPNGYFNLGLAHGQPGPVGFLARAARRPEVAARAGALIEDAIRWLLAQRREHDPETCFPRIVSDPPAMPGGQLAWCYGDVGISLALFDAGVRLDRTVWREAALAVARRSARRWLEGAESPDAGLCHGTSSMLLFSVRFWEYTGEELFARAARHAVRETLRRCEPDSRFAFRVLRQAGRNGVPEIVDDPSLLNGAAGVGLALLAAIASPGDGWDRLLLTDRTGSRTGP